MPHCAPNRARSRVLTRFHAKLVHILPVLVLVAGFIAFFATGAYEYVSFDSLREHRATLQHWVMTHAVIAILVYFLTYVVVIAFSLPGGLLMTTLGGFLFGTWFGGAVVVVAATLGAILLFLAARTAVGNMLRTKAGSTIDRMEAGFRQNAMSYLLVLRLVPLFPFFLVNLVPAFLGVRLSTNVIATFFGIIPGTFVYASVGNGFGAIFDRGGEPDFGIIYNPEIIGPLLALAVLSCLPIAYKRFKRNEKA